jgi:hypothetical protein
MPVSTVSTATLNKKQLNILKERFYNFYLFKNFLVEELLNYVVYSPRKVNECPMTSWVRKMVKELNPLAKIEKTFVDRFGDLILENERVTIPGKLWHVCFINAIDSLPVKKFDAEKALRILEKVRSLVDETNKCNVIPIRMQVIDSISTTNGTTSNNNKKKTNKSKSRQKKITTKRTNGGTL